MPRVVACTLLLLAALGIGQAPGCPARAADALLLGTLERSAAPDDTVPQWRRVQAAIARERPLLDACAAQANRCPEQAATWLAFLDGLRAASPLEQVRAVHRFANAWPYRSDKEVFGRSDYWASPLEFFAHAGDCEDFAIAKYVSLRRLGFAPELLRIVVLEDTVRRLAHAVLTVRLGGKVLVLDNLAEEVVPQAQLAHYVPYYSLNELGHWQHAVPTRDLAAGNEGEPPAAASQMRERSAR